MSNSAVNMGFTNFFLLGSSSLITPYYVCAFLLMFSLFRLSPSLAAFLPTLLLRRIYGSFHKLFVFTYALLCECSQVDRRACGHGLSLLGPRPLLLGLEQASPQGVHSSAPACLSQLRRFCWCPGAGASCALSHFMDLCVESVWSHYNSPPRSLVTVVAGQFHGAAGSVCGHGRMVVAAG